MQTALIILMTLNITLFFTHHTHGHFKQAHEKNKFKIAAGLFNSVKNKQHLVIAVTFEIQ